MVNNQRENTIFVSVQNYSQSLTQNIGHPSLPWAQSSVPWWEQPSAILKISSFISRSGIHEYLQRKICRYSWVEAETTTLVKKACTAKCSVCTESDLNMIELPCLISSEEKLPRITLISRKGCCQPLSGSKFNVLCYLLYPWHPVVGKQNACLLLLAKITVIFFSSPGLLRKCSLCSICLPPQGVSKPLGSSQKLEESCHWLNPTFSSRKVWILLTAQHRGGSGLSFPSWRAGILPSDLEASLR